MTALVELPTCPNGHGRMVLRQAPSDLAAWCGVWYDCPPGPPGGTCQSSFLFDSPALREHLAAVAS